MRRLLTWLGTTSAVLALTLTGAVAAQAADTPPNPNSKPGYTLDFAEEFSGTSLNTSRWLPNYLPHWVPDADRARTAARYTVSNGTIKLRVEQNQLPWNPDQDGTVVSSAIQSYNANNWHKFNSLAVNRSNQPTHNGYSTKYGYFEVRAKKANVGGGGHQAVWLVGTNSGTTAQPEIDFIETFFRTPNQWRIAAYGWGDPNFLSSWYLAEPTVPGSPTTEFHIYGMDWTPWSLKFYYDGQLVRTINDAPNTAMGIIMNIYTGAGSGSPNSTWPKTFEVDYLRVFKSNAGYSEALSTTWKLIDNRARDGLLHIQPNDGRLRFGDIAVSSWSAHWLPETTSAGYTRFKNRWTNEYMFLGSSSQIRHGTVTASQTTADWSRVTVTTTFFRIQNRSSSGYLHVENNTGYPEIGNVSSSWWSSHWELKAAPAG